MAITRRALAVVVGALVLAGCGGGGDGAADASGPSTAEPTTTTAEVTTTTAASTTTTLGQAAAEELVASLTASGTFLGLPEFPYEPSAPDVSCLSGEAEPVAELVHLFVTDDRTTEGFAEVHQSTAAHSTPDAARQAMHDTLDAYEQCDQQVASDGVTDGWAAATVPAGVTIEARAVTATLTIAEGNTFPHAYGCVVRSAVVQCVQVWSFSTENTAHWFELGLVETATNLAANVPA